MRTYLFRVGLCLLVGLQIGVAFAANAHAEVDGITAQQLRERTDLRAAARYAEGLAEFAAAMAARSSCPLPGAEITDSWGAPRSGGRSHEGTDIMSPEGTPILAPEAGTIEYRTTGLGGLSFFLDTGERVWYGTHLSGYEGDARTVTAGDVVGYVGMTGNAPVPHLHISYDVGGVTTNAYPWLVDACEGTGAVAPSPVTTAPPETVEAGPRVTFVYSAGEVVRWLRYHRAGTHYGRAQVLALRDWWNGITWQRVAAYVRAMTPDCRPGLPDACAALIRQVFARYGLDGNAAVRVAQCESGLSPTATNGSHDGLFQQASAYWAERAARYGVGGRSAFDGEANAIVSAGMVRDDGDWGQWSCRP